MWELKSSPTIHHKSAWPRTRLSITKPSVRCIRRAVVLIAQRSEQAGGNWKLQQPTKVERVSLGIAMDKDNSMQQGSPTKRRVTIMVKRWQ